MDKLNDSLLQDANYRLAKHWWLSSTVAGYEYWIGVVVVNEDLSQAGFEVQVGCE